MNELRKIPGVGEAVSADLNEIGIYKVEQLKNKDPKGLYEELCRKQGFSIDRCMLYVLRCAVYFASNKKHDPKLLNWWNWKDN